MVKSYVLDIRKLNTSEIYEKYMGEMSDFRLNKINRLKNSSDKARSLGIGIITDEHLKTVGLREKDMTYYTDKNGKEYFRNANNLFFNCSHSGNYSVCSFSDKEVGCDIESLGKKNLMVAKRYFTEKECKYIFSNEDVTKQVESFIRIWTIKESYLKWLGTGLLKPLNSFEVCGLEEKISIYDQNIPEQKCKFAEYKLDNALLTVCSEDNPNEEKLIFLTL